MTTAAEIRIRILTGQQVKIGVVGDSVSRGYYAADAATYIGSRGMEASTVQNPGAVEDSTSFGAWHVQLRSMLKAHNPLSVLRNYGVSGAGTKQEYVATSFYWCPAGYANPLAMAVGDACDLVLMACGINDATHSDPTIRCATLDEYLANVQTAINTCNSAGIVPVLVVPNKVRDLAGGYDAVNDIDRFNNTFAPAIRSLASTQGLEYVDVYAAFESSADYASLMHDEVHPNQLGHDTWMQVLSSWVDSGRIEIFAQVLPDFVATPPSGIVAPLGAQTEGARETAAVPGGARWSANIKA